MLSRIATFAAPARREFMIGTMQTQLNRLVNEVSTGRKADPMAELGSGASLLYQLQAQSDRQGALRTSITMASHRLDTAQAALTSLEGITRTVANTVQGWTSSMNQGMAVVAEQASSTMNTAVNLLNTSHVGGAVFGGSVSDTPPMRASDAPGGMEEMAETVLNAAVAAKGGPLDQSDIAALMEDFERVFNDTHPDPDLRYSGGAYVGATDGTPTRVMIGTSQSMQYDTSASQAPFRDLMRGLSMLSLLDVATSRMDETGKKELLSKAGTVLRSASNDLTVLQGSLGAIQGRLSDAADAQRTAAQATEVRILSYVEADSYGNATKISMLQTQMQATYALTAQISQLSMVRYMPSV
jgi:flagellar hook-associated protein 3 FlgL